MALFPLWLYATFTALGALLVALHSALIYFETVRTGALHFRIHRVALPAAVCLLLSNALLCALVHFPSSHALQIAIDILRDADVLCADIGIVVVGYSTFQTTLFNVGLAVRRDTLWKARKFLTWWLAIEALLFFSVYIARPIVNLEWLVVIYYFYWCIGMLAGSALLTYASRVLNRTLPADLRSQLFFHWVLVRIYVTVCIAAVVVTAVALVGFLNNRGHDSSLVYFGHDQTRWFELVKPIASIIVLMLAALPTLHSTYSDGAVESSSSNESRCGPSALGAPQHADMPAWLVPANSLLDGNVDVGLGAMDNDSAGAAPLLRE